MRRINSRFPWPVDALNVWHLYEQFSLPNFTSFRDNFFLGTPLCQSVRFTLKTLSRESSRYIHSQQSVSRFNFINEVLNYTNQSKPSEKTWSKLIIDLKVFDSSLPSNPDGSIAYWVLFTEFSSFFSRWRIITHLACAPSCDIPNICHLLAYLTQLESCSLCHHSSTFCHSH